MKIRLTPHLLAYLIRQGYKYCKANMEMLQYKDRFPSVILTPIKQKPQLSQLHQNFDTYYRTIDEPFQMSSGQIVNGDVFVKLNKADMKDYGDLL